MKKSEISEPKKAPKRPVRKRDYHTIKAKWSIKIKKSPPTICHWVPMPYSHQRELFDVCEAMWALVSKRLTLLVLTTQEIEDLKSAAMIRPFQKFALFRPEKGPLDIWVKTIMRRSLMNELRKILPDRRTRELHEMRMRLLRSERIDSVVIDTDYLGVPVVQTTNDLFDPRNVGADSYEMREETKTFAKSLPPRHSRIAEMILRGDTIREAADTEGIALNNCYVISRKIRSDWMKWLDGPAHSPFANSE